MRMKRYKAQASFELLITLTIGLAILLPIVTIAFIQVSSANSSLSAIEAQQASGKLASIATLVGSEGPPAKQVVQLSVPPGIRYIYLGTPNNSVGHEIIFVISSPSGLSYITSYTPINVTGNLGGITSTGTYLVNVTSYSSCPTYPQVSCVYMSPVV